MNSTGGSKAVANSFDLIERAYNIMSMAGYRIAEHNSEHNNPVIAWMTDARTWLAESRLASHAEREGPAIDQVPDVCENLGRHQTDPSEDKLDRIFAGVGVCPRCGFNLPELAKDAPAPSAASGLVEEPCWYCNAVGNDPCAYPEKCRRPNWIPNLCLRMLNAAVFADTYHPSSGKLLREAVRALRSHQAPVGEEDDRPDIPTLEQAREELAGISDSEWANYLEGLVRAHERRARSPQTGGGS